MRQGVYSTPVWISRPSQLICPSLDTRDSHGGVQCPAGALPGYRVWRHPWPIRAFDLHKFSHSVWAHIAGLGHTN